MAHKFAEIGFTDAVKSVQQTMGSRSAYARREVGSTGNVATDNRISLLLIDSPNRRRLKIFGRMHVIGTQDDAALAARLTLADYASAVERVMLIKVEAFDWNCPQHIPPVLPKTILPQLSPLTGSVDGCRTNRRHRKRRYSA
ncbi:hypothetical protein [Mesorhizobium sp. M0085]|uniref:hypothetical protein n=1 Tax=Mesorhizobium sp. M0085 TaxID=2956872 RepID=UPI0033387A0C